MDLLRDAEEIAIYQHRHQNYDLWPYHKHLKDVVEVGKKHDFPIFWLCSCWLHDVVEDGALSISKINKVFGADISYIVACVTDPIDLSNRELKKSVVYNKIKNALVEGNEGPLAVKLADRIANTAHSIRMQSSQSQMYKGEFQKFKQSLYQNGCSYTIQQLWNELESLNNLVVFKK